MKVKDVVKLVMSLFVFLTSMQMTLAQGFVAPYPLPNLGDGARVILKNGEEIKGKWFGMTGTPKNLKNIQVRDETKTRRKFLTPDVDRVFITLSGLMKFQQLADASTVTKTRGFIFKKDYVDKGESVYGMIKNWDSIMKDNTEIVFDVISVEEGKYGLRQLLNPGFDRKYRIYQWGHGVSVMGKAYPELMLINKKGEVFTTKSKNYQENFKKLFGDCPEFMEQFDPTQVDMEDIPLHLFLYTEMSKE